MNDDNDGGMILTALLIIGGLAVIATLCSGMFVLSYL